MIVSVKRSVLLLLTGAMLGGTVATSAPYSEDVEFQSRGARLSGTIFFPEASPPLAALVLVQGSGPQERMTALAQVLAANSLAVLTYDKRGAGASGGMYESIAGGDDVSSANLELLAEDAASAFSLLSAHPDVVGVPTGYVGASQAGWTIPIAASRSPDVAFMAFWVAPVTKVSEQLRLQASMDDDPVSSQRTLEYTERILSDDTDPCTSLSELTVPGLWLFGDQDKSIPVSLSISRLEELIDQGHDFEHQTFPGRGHSIGGSSDPMVKTAIEWIQERALNR